MALKLYKFEVTQTTTMVVAAEDPESARRMAPGYADDAFRDASPDNDVSFCGEVKDEKDLVSWDWDVNSLPYGDDVDSQECGAILKSMAEDKAVAEFDAKQLTLLPEDGK
jgi:hypothetical protein